MARTIRFAAASMVVICGSLTAQTGEYEDTGEVTAYTGIAFGRTGTGPAVGGATGITLSRYAIALIDASFMPIGSRTLRRATAPSNSRLYDFNFVVHVPIPIERWTRRWSPYGLAGAAFLYNTYQSESIQADGRIGRSGRNDVLFGFEAGGGVRYYMRDNWGFRGEFRYTASTRDFGRILAGVFYRFSAPWF